MIITIDGPSGAGKGTLAKKIANHLGFAYLDTGLLFRALAFKAKQQNVVLDDVRGLSALANTLVPLDWQQDGLRHDDVAHNASILAPYPAVRLALKKLSQDFAAFNNKEGKGAVLDGRDIGTVVCPNAEKKLFITASSAVRAHRRYIELQLGGFTGTLAKVLSDIERRDKRDQSRELDPLKPALDAVIIDTTDLSRTDVFNLALNYILKPCPQ